MRDEDRIILRRILKEWGVVGVTAVMSEWVIEYGGLTWIKKCIGNITPEEVKARLDIYQ